MVTIAISQQTYDDILECLRKNMNPRLSPPFLSRMPYAADSGMRRISVGWRIRKP